MNGEKFNLFFTLVKLKFYLVSMLDSPNEVKSFYFTEEFLDRRVPEQKDTIVNSLKSHGISGDSEIAFDDSAVIKFKEIAREKEDTKDLNTILGSLEIESKALTESASEVQRTERERHAHNILDSLFQLSSNWVMHKELENNFENFSILDEEDVIRPEEAEQLNVLNSNTTTSFKMITALTLNYLEQLTDYYFKYGGDLQLKEFLNNLEKLKRQIEDKYKELFRNFGLDQD